MADVSSTERGYEAEVAELLKRFRAGQTEQAFLVARLASIAAEHARMVSNGPRICLDIHVYIDGKLQAGMTENTIKALEPKDFDLFLDLMDLRLGFGSSKQRQVLDSEQMRQAGLQSSHLFLLEKLLLTKPGRSITNLRVPKRGEADSYWQRGAMSKAVCFLRRALQDKPPWKYIKCSSANCRQVEEGWAYMIPEDVHTCLIRRAE